MTLELSHFSAAVLFSRFRISRFRNHPAQHRPRTDPLRHVLLCDVCRRSIRGGLGDVDIETLSFQLSAFSLTSASSPHTAKFVIPTEAQRSKRSGGPCVAEKLKAEAESYPTLPTRTRRTRAWYRIPGAYRASTARALASVTVRESKEKFRWRRFATVAAINNSPNPRERYSGKTHTWVTCPTSWRTREHKISPTRLRARLCTTTKDPSGSNVPHPGKRTILFRKRRDPLRVRY